MSLIFSIILSLELLFVSFFDWKFKKISNYWSIGNIIVFPFLFLIFPTNYRLQLSVFEYPLLILIITFILFSIKIMGAGDAKFLSTFLLLIPEKFHDEFLKYLLEVTIIVATILIILRLFAKLKEGINLCYLRNYREMLSLLVSRKSAFAPIILLAWSVFFIKIIL